MPILITPALLILARASDWARAFPANAVRQADITRQKIAFTFPLLSMVGLASWPASLRDVASTPKPVAPYRTSVLRCGAKPAYAAPSGLGRIISGSYIIARPQL